MAMWKRSREASSRERIIALLRRQPRGVDELARVLGVTGNAVRAQLTALERDGLVRAAGVRRSGGAGKPATVYALAPEAEAELSHAYAPLLEALLRELGDRMRPADLEAALRGAGRRLAPGIARASSYDDRVRAALDFLGQLGGDADLLPRGDGFELQAHGCPLARAVVARPESCRVLEAVLSEMTGTPVREHCEKGEHPSCRFSIAAPKASARASRH